MATAVATAPITEESTSRFVQTKRWKLHYNEVGSGHPIIALHGMGPGATGWSNFHQNAPGLSAANRVIMLDFPGWGGSDAFDCANESRDDANAEAVKLLMDELGLEQAVLIGNSMGGMATLKFMAAYPDRISHAITMGSGLYQLPNSVALRGMSAGMHVIIDTYRDPSPANFRRLVEVMVFDPSFVTDALTEQRSAGALQRPDHLEKFLKWWGNPTGGMFRGLEDLLGKLAQSKVPTLMIHGRDDRTVAMETSLRTASLIPNARSVILNRCGHWAQLEHTAEFDRLVSGFIAADASPGAKPGVAG